VIDSTLLISLLSAAGGVVLTVIPSWIVVRRCRKRSALSCVTPAFHSNAGRKLTRPRVHPSDLKVWERMDGTQVARAPLRARVTSPEPPLILDEELQRVYNRVHGFVEGDADA
jgi:hypothetical protein